MEDRRLVAHPNLILKTMRDVGKDVGFRFISHPKDFNCFSEWDDANCLIITKEYRARFHLQQMPGCCAALIIHHVEVRPYSQKTFDQVLKYIEEGACQAGFGSVMMAQVVPPLKYDVRFKWEDEPWIKCLERAWQASEPFRNAKSGNLVIYLTKDLGQYGKRHGLEFQVHPLGS